MMVSTFKKNNKLVIRLFIVENKIFSFPKHFFRDFDCYAHSRHNFFFFLINSTLRLSRHLYGDILKS